MYTRLSTADAATGTTSTALVYSLLCISLPPTTVLERSIYMLNKQHLHFLRDTLRTICMRKNMSQFLPVIYVC